MNRFFWGLALIFWACSGSGLPQGVQELEMRHEPQAKNIEVLEFMWLGCPHCRTFHQNWVSLKRRFSGRGVRFGSVPAPFDNWRFDARVYLAFEKLGLISDGLLANYYAVRQGAEAKSFAGDSEKVAEWLSQRYDRSKEDFLEVFDSSSLESRLKDIEDLIGKYPVGGVPSVLISVVDTQKSYFVPFAHSAARTEKTIRRLLEDLVSE